MQSEVKGREWQSQNSQKDIAVCLVGLLIMNFYNLITQIYSQQSDLQCQQLTRLMQKILWLELIYKKRIPSIQRHNKYIFKGSSEIESVRLQVIIYLYTSTI